MAMFRAMLGRDAEPAAIEAFRGLSLEAIARGMVGTSSSWSGIVGVVRSCTITRFSTPRA